MSRKCLSDLPLQVLHLAAASFGLLYLQKLSGIGIVSCAINIQHGTFCIPKYVDFGSCMYTAHCNVIATTWL